MHREAAAEGASKHTCIPGLTQLCFQHCFSYLQEILKQFHPIPLRDTEEHYCACSPDRDIGRFKASPKVIPITDRARNST